MSSIGNIQQSQGFDPQQYASLIQKAETQGVSSGQVDAKLLAAINAGQDFTQAFGLVSAELPSLAPPISTAPNSANLQQLGALPPAGTLSENLDRNQLVLGIVNGSVQVAAGTLNADDRVVRQIGDDSGKAFNPLNTDRVVRQIGDDSGKAFNPLSNADKVLRPIDDGGKVLKPIDDGGKVLRPMDDEVTER
jgi:hypothetical protein